MAISAKNITYQIGEKTLIEDVSLDILSGEVTAIIGPNGAGKSTLLKCLTGSLRPTIGNVFVNGLPLSGYGLKQLSKIRAVLSQTTVMNFPFTSREIVMMGRTPHVLHHESPKDHLIVEDILSLLDVQHLKGQLFSTLSGGEKQRIQFARVLAQIWDQENACLFLDEPTSALDLKQQISIISVAKDMARDKGFAVCLVLHDLKMAKFYADNIVVLKSGKLVSSGAGMHIMTPELISNVFDISPEYADHL